MITRQQRTIAALGLLAALLAGCSPGNQGTAARAMSSSSPAPTPLNLVVIGDSIPLNGQDICPGCRGFADQYADALSRASGRQVATHNYSKGTGLTLPELLENLPDLREPLSTADAIIVGIAHNSIPLNDSQPCGSVADPNSGIILDWTMVNQACAEKATTTYRPMYDQLFTTISGWRQGKPTILRTINKYSDWVGWPTAHLTRDQTRRTVLIHDAWNTMLCASATAHGFSCADIYHAFNGPNGLKPSGQLLGPDYTHPSQAGNDLIAATLIAQGFKPLA